MRARPTRSDERKSVADSSWRTVGERQFKYQHIADSSWRTVDERNRFKYPCRGVGLPE